MKRLEMKPVTPLGSTLILVMTIAALLVGFPEILESQESEGLAEIILERAQATVTPVAAAVRHLPELEEIPVEDEVFRADARTAELPVSDVPVPDIPRDAVTPAGMIAEQDQVFFNAALGGGSVNSILGSINVYRLGEGPQFQVGYDHEGSDGFGLKQPGTGFFVQENELDTWVRLGDDGPLTLEIEGGYADRRFGLQQLSPYYSQDTRAFSGQLRSVYSPETRFTLEGIVSFRDQQRVLSTGESGLESARNGYRRVSPEVKGTLEWPRFLIGLTGRYDGAFSTGMELDGVSVFSGELNVETVPLDGLTLGARGSVIYRMNNGIFFPVDGYLAYRGNERWTLDLSGGYRLRENDPTLYWVDYPALDWEPGTTVTEKRLPADELFFADAALGVTAIPGVLDLRGGVGRTWHRNRLVVDTFNSVLATYPYRLTTFTAIDSELQAEMTVNDGLRLAAGWLASWEDRLFGMPAHRVEASLTGEVSELLGTARVLVPLDGGPGILPQVDLEMRYEMFRDVEFRLYALDILAPGLDDGRSLRGVQPDDDDPFISAGLQLGAAVRVSF